MDARSRCRVILSIVDRMGWYGAVWGGASTVEATCNPSRAATGDVRCSHAPSIQWDQLLAGLQRGLCRWMRGRCEGGLTQLWGDGASLAPTTAHNTSPQHDAERGIARWSIAPTPPTPQGPIATASSSDGCEVETSVTNLRGMRQSLHQDTQRRIGAMQFLDG